MTPFENWIIIENDAKKMADQVIEYLEHPEKYQKMVDDAHNWVELHTWEKMVDNYLQLWGD